MIAKNRKNMNPERNAPRKIWHPKDRRLTSLAAAQRARHVATIAASNDSRRDAFDEQTLFIAFHTCGYRATRRPRTGSVSEAERLDWLRLRADVRSYLVQRNLGLVYHALRHFRSDPTDRDDYCAEGMLALVRAVDHFDPWRGVRLSTYAYNSIIRAIARLRKRSDKRRLFTVPFETDAEMPERMDRGNDLYVDRLRTALDHNLADLTDRESVVLRRRFPSSDERRLTLDEIGVDCGLSKERIRQIQNRALRKLYNVLAADPMLQ